MAYIVLARKWRPKTFQEVMGQEHVTQTLQNAIRENRLGHAFIFSGPRGVGKTTIARLLAKAVNLPDPTQDLSTLQDDNADEQPLDLIEIDGASNRGIDEIRNLRENIRFAPVSSRYKVYIIDEVHMLSKDAFNALLKTLEEPPSHALFIFATTEIHRVPPTILSRCQRFDFKRLTTTQIVEQLQRIATAENIDIAKDGLSLIARKADGGMRDATSILDQISSLGDQHIDLDTVQKALGIIKADLFFTVGDLILKKDDAGLLRFAQNLITDGHDILNFLQGLTEHFRNLMVTRAAGSAELLELADQFRQAYEKQAPSFEVNDLLQFTDILIQNEQLLKFSENPQLILELLLLKLAHKPLAIQMEELLQLMRQNPGGAAASSTTSGPKSSGPSGGDNLPNAGGPSATPKPDQTETGSAPKGSSQPEASLSKLQEPQKADPSSPSKNPEDLFATLGKLNLPGNGKNAPSQHATLPATETEEPPAAKSVPPVAISSNLAQIKQDWEKVIGIVRSKKVGLASFLQEGVPQLLNGNLLEIAFDLEQTFHISHVDKNRSIIEAALEEVFKEKISFVAKNISFKEAGIEKKIVTADDLFEDMKDKEPVLKKIIDLFDCENIDERK